MTKIPSVATNPNAVHSIQIHLPMFREQHSPVNAKEYILFAKGCCRLPTLGYGFALLVPWATEYPESEKTAQLYLPHLSLPTVQIFFQLIR